MSTAATFLGAFSHALASMSLYREGHPARARAIDGAYEQLQRLQQEQGTVRFTFLRDEIVCGDHPLRELKSWEWGVRLSEAGIQRLEFEAGVARDDFEGFLEAVFERLVPTGASSSEAQRVNWSNAAFDTQYASTPGNARNPVTLETFTMFPRRSIKLGKAFCIN